MRTDADHPARVRDPAIELLLSQTATLTDEWCAPDSAFRVTSARTEPRDPTAAFRHALTAQIGTSPRAVKGSNATHYSRSVCPRWDSNPH
jgi:hypothetical protein